MSVPPADLPYAPSLGSYRARRPSGPIWVRAYLKRLIGWDLAVGVLGGVIAAVWRFGEDLTWPYALVSMLVPPVWVLVLVLSNAYERRYLGVNVEEYRALTRAVGCLLAVMAIAAFMLNVLLARAYVLILLPVLLAGGLGVRWGMRRWLANRRRHGQLMQRTLVVGRVDAAGALVRSIRREPDQGLLPVAVCASSMDGEPITPEGVGGVVLAGGPRDALAVAERFNVEVVAVASHPDLAGKALRRLAWALEARGIELLVNPGLLDVAGPRLSIRPSADLSLLHVERPSAGWRSLAKQLMDRALAALFVLMASPVLLGIAIAIKMDSPGPVFFRQKRVGIGGELFEIIKFRTMVVDAEARLAALTHRSDGNSVLFKMQDDPRVTKIGAVLRRYSLDELPQLFNVILGDMSLVGPRPPLASEVAQYEPDALRRLHVRPGMTGLWQVSGRSDLSWEESLRLDLRYVDNWSPIGDLHILARTAHAVVRGAGAY